MSWDDWSASNAPPIVEEDKWHVALAPGEVKVVSLEQLDDLFRLSIVDAETKVWQNGMSEWQPLRVIAGIDEEPAPEPKRTYPRPPSPKSAPPPPRPQSVAPTPNYATPLALAPTQPSFMPAAAVPLNQFASVRPLVVSQTPQPARRGGGFGRFLLSVAVIAGVGISLYRNDVVRDAAQSLHQEPLFKRLESALGGPAFGTLRAVEQQSTLPEATALTLPAVRAASAAAAESVPPTRAAASAPANLGATPPVVSLESLAPEKAGAARPKSEPLVAAAAPANKSPVIQAKLEVPVPAKASPIAKAPSPLAKAAPAEKAAAPVAAEKPESEMTARERLNAAIGRSMLSSPPKASKAARSKGNSDYDPLNPKL